MRIRGKPAAGFEFAPEIFKLLARKPAFEKRARVDSGRGVALKVNDVAFEFRRMRAEKMVEADFVERGRGSVGGDVPADVVLFAVRAHHHGQRVPANQALDAAFELLIAREIGLHPVGNGVDEGRVGGERNLYADNFRVRAQPLQDVGSHVRAARLQHGVQRFKPLLNLGGIRALHRNANFIVHRVAWHPAARIYFEVRKRPRFSIALLEYTQSRSPHILTDVPVIPCATLVRARVASLRARSPVSGRRSPR